MKRLLSILLCVCISSNVYAGKHKVKHKHKKKRKVVVPELVIPKFVPYNSQEGMEQRVYNEINTMRIAYGLPKLLLNDYLNQIARQNSQNIALGVVEMQHGGFEDRSNIIYNKMPYIKLTENIGWNRHSPDPVNSAIRGWMNSPHHFANILDRHEQTGIGVVLDQQGRYIFTQLFWTKKKG